MTTSSTPGPRFSQRREWAARQAISFLMQQGVENPECISLAAGLVDAQTLPTELVRDTVAELLADDASARIALQYGTTPGADAVRATMLAHFARLEGVPVGELGVGIDRVVLTTGSQQLLSIVAEVLLDPGDICLVAAPTYFVFLGTLNGVGARPVPVAADEDGIRPEALEQTLEELEVSGTLDRVKLIYAVDYHENPSGASLSEDRRRDLLAIAERWSRSHLLYVLEDAAYRELRYDGPELPSLWSLDASRERVILAQTFSKSFSPGLRVGFGILPEALVEPVCDRKGNEDFGSANFNQRLVAAAIESGRYEAHVARVRDGYRVKRDAMLAAAEKHLADLPGLSWRHPHGGLYVWLTLPEHVDTGFDGELFRRAVDEGVMYVPGELCFAHPEGERPRNHARLSFGVQDPAGIDRGMERLARALRRTL